MKLLLTFCLMLVSLVLVVRSEEKRSVVGVYLSSSGIESKRLVLYQSGDFTARWDGDIGSNGVASGKWRLEGGEVHLMAERETLMLKGYLKSLLITDYKGRPGLLRKEDVDFVDNPYFYLFMQDPAHDVSRGARPNQALEPTSTSVTNPAGAGLAPAVAVAHLKR